MATIRDYTSYALRQAQNMEQDHEVSGMLTVLNHLRAERAIAEEFRSPLVKVYTAAEEKVTRILNLAVEAERAQALALIEAKLEDMKSKEEQRADLLAQKAALLGEVS